MVMNLKRFLPKHKSENDAEVSAENPKNSKKKLLVGVLAGVAIVGVGLYAFSLYLFPATEDYPMASGEFLNAPSELFGPSAESSPSPPLPVPGNERNPGSPENQTKSSPEPLGAVASGEPQDFVASIPAKPAAPVEDIAVTAPEAKAIKEPLSEAATVDAGEAVKKGKEIYDLQYDLELKRLQLELAKLDAEIAEQNLKTLPTIINKVEDSEADGPEPPKTGPVPDMLPMMSIGNPGSGQSGQEKESSGLTAITGDKAIINGKVVRVGSVYNGMKVVAINPRLGVVRLRSPIGGAETEMSM